MVARNSGQRIAMSLVISLLLGVLLITTVTTAVALATDRDLFIALGVLVIEGLVYPVCSFIALGDLASGRIRTYLIVSVIVPATKLGISFLSFIVFGPNMIFWVLTVGIGGVFLLIILLAREGIRSGWAFSRLELDWLRRGIPFGLVGSISATSDNIDRISISWSLNDFETGVYGAGAKLVSFAMLPARAIGVVVYPKYFELTNTNDQRGLRKLAWKTVLKGLPRSFIAIILTICLAHILQITILSSYDNLMIYVAILSLLVPLKSIQYAMGDVLYASNRAKSRLLLASLSAVLSLSAISFSASIFGGVGAAVAAVIAVAISTTIYISFVEKCVFRSE